MLPPGLHRNSQIMLKAQLARRREVCEASYRAFQSFGLFFTTSLVAFQLDSWQISQDQRLALSPAPATNITAPVPAPAPARVRLHIQGSLRYPCDIPAIPAVGSLSSPCCSSLK